MYFGYNLEQGWPTCSPRGMHSCSLFI